MPKEIQKATRGSLHYRGCITLRIKKENFKMMNDTIMKSKTAEYNCSIHQLQCEIGKCNDSEKFLRPIYGSIILINNKNWPYKWTGVWEEYGNLTVFCPLNHLPALSLFHNQCCIPNLVSRVNICNVLILSCTRGWALSVPKVNEASATSSQSCINVYDNYEFVTLFFGWTLFFTCICC